jgi:hypothetical protein
MAAEPSADQLTGPGLWLVATETSAYVLELDGSGAGTLVRTSARARVPPPRQQNCLRRSRCGSVGMATKYRLPGPARRSSGKSGCCSWTFGETGPRPCAAQRWSAGRRRPDPLTLRSVFGSYRTPTVRASCLES